jgi:peptide/nickel transport system permease protein
MAEIETHIEVTDIFVPASRIGEAWSMCVANKAALFGLIALVLIIALSLIGPILYLIDPYDIVSAPMTPPGKEHIFGTDYLGRDVFAGVVHGAQTTLFVGFTATLCTVFIGILIGALSGFYGKWVDNFLMRLTEFFLVLPPLLLAMVLVVIFSPSLITIIFAIGVVTWTDLARLTRAEFLKIKEREFIMAERAIGTSNRHIMWLVTLPNASPPLIVASALGIGRAILFESMLSFLGLGDPNVFSWGYMIGASRDYIFDTWWAVTLPGLAIFLTVLSISLIGDGLNDALNPKLRLL